MKKSNQIKTEGRNYDSERLGQPTVRLGLIWAGGEEHLELADAGYKQWKGGGSATEGT